LKDILDENNIKYDLSAYELTGPALQTYLDKSDFSISILFFFHIKII